MLILFVSVKLTKHGWFYEIISNAGSTYEKVLYTVQSFHVNYTV
jgi:hypothetical protein